MRRILMPMLGGALTNALDFIKPISEPPQIGSGARRYYRDRSRYMPHQGKREIARRLRKAAAS